jgi:hypothetical protein
MWKNSILVLAAFVIAPPLGYAQDTKTVLDGVSKAMGEVKSLQYSGSGAFFSLGQELHPWRAMAALRPKELHPHDRLRDAGAAR